MANLLPTLGKLPTVLIFPAPVPMLESYLPGWCSALINKGADIWGSRPSHSGAVILEDAPSGVLHSVIFGREGLRLRGPQLNKQRRRRRRRTTHNMRQADTAASAGPSQTDSATAQRTKNKEPDEQPHAQKLCHPREELNAPTPEQEARRCTTMCPLYGRPL